MPLALPTVRFLASRLRALPLVFVLCALPAVAAPVPDASAVRYLLDRVGFGPGPGDIDRVMRLGIDDYLREQLRPDSISESPDLERRLSRLTTLRMDPVALFREYGPPRHTRGEKPDPDAIKAARRRARIIVEEATEARLLRAIESPRQLQESMVDFWFNHFNVFAGKGLDHLWVGAFEAQAIRPYVLGQFRDLLGATAHHPAMLFYLDNWLNTAPSSRGARGQFEGINENYARELMELHTLGVDGGYSQADVIALAHILTGWGLPRDRRRSSLHNGFYFDAARHDYGDKTFLGHRIQGSGEDEGEQALDLLARSPATAHHIAFELAQYFVADDPPRTLVARLADRFLSTDGDIRATLDTLFHSPEFWDARYRGTKFKSPYRYVVSALRASGIVPINVQPLRGALSQLGMPIYGCLTPNGYGDTQASWLNADAIMRRLSFATALGAGRLPLADESKPVDAVSLVDTVGGIDDATQRVVSASPLALRAGLVLGGPRFMRY